MRFGRGLPVKSQLPMCSEIRLRKWRTYIRVFTYINNARSYVNLKRFLKQEKPKVKAEENTL